MEAKDERRPFQTSNLHLCDVLKIFTEAFEKPEDVKTISTTVGKEHWIDAVLYDRDPSLAMAKLHIAVVVVLKQSIAYNVKRRAEESPVLRLR